MLVSEDMVKKTRLHFVAVFLLRVLQVNTVYEAAHISEVVCRFALASSVWEYNFRAENLQEIQADRATWSRGAYESIYSLY